MSVAGSGAALVFAATFLLLALGRVGRLPVPRGVTALAGGIATALLLVPAGHMRYRLWDLVDWQVMLLLAGLMGLAGLAESAGLFAGVRRRLLLLLAWLALWSMLVLVAATSAVLLNDAAVIVLVPFLIPAARASGLPLVPSVILMAVAANIGSVATPFGNPQNAVLARVAGLDVVDFLRVQGPIALMGILVLGAAAWSVARHREAQEAPAPHPARPRARWAILVAVALFLTLAVAFGQEGIGFGGAAVVAALVAYLLARPSLGREADRAGWQSLDWNVLSLFAGLYLLTAGLSAWLPADAVPLASLDSPAKAALATTLLSNVVGNVPAILTFAGIDAAWTASHAQFLVATSTLGGALLLTGSAASLLAAEQARKSGVEVRFWAFARLAVPWTLPLLVLGAWWTWPR